MRLLLPLLLGSFLPFALAQSTAEGMSRAYICQHGDGPIVLVKAENLPNVRDALCRAIEYREAVVSELRRCTLHNGGGLFTDANLFRVEAGCRVLKGPLR